MANSLLLSRYIIGLIIIVLYQVVVAHRISISGFEADLALIFTIWVALVHGHKPGAYFGFIAGILIGVLNPLELGWAALLLTILGYTAGTISNKLEIDPMPIKGLILFISALAFNLFMLLFTKFELILVNPNFVFAHSLFPALYSAILGLVVFYLIRYRFVIKDLL